MASCQTWLDVERAWCLQLPSRYYAEPKAKAAHIKNHIAFYKVRPHTLGVQIETERHPERTRLSSKIDLIPHCRRLSPR